MYTRWGILQNQLLATPLYDKVSFDARVVTFGGLFYSSPAPLPQTDLHGLFLVEFIYHHVALSSSSHMGTVFFTKGVKIFSCTWVRNGYRGGNVFGCHSLGEEGGKEGEEKFYHIRK